MLYYYSYFCIEKDKEEKDDINLKTKKNKEWIKCGQTKQQMDTSHLSEARKKMWNEIRICIYEA